MSNVVILIARLLLFCQTLSHNSEICSNIICLHGHDNNPHYLFYPLYSLSVVREDTDSFAAGVHDSGVYEDIPLRVVLLPVQSL